MQGFVFRLPPHKIAYAIFMQSFQYDLHVELQETHRLTHTISRIIKNYYPFPFITTSLSFLTTSHRPHLPSSPLPFLTTSLPHHFPSPPPPFLTTPLHHHFPSSPLPIVPTSLPHHSPSSPLPFLTTSLRHYLPSSPLPFITTSLPHHFFSSPLPFVTTLCHPFLFFCYVLLYDLPPITKVNSVISYSIALYGLLCIDRLYIII